MRQVHREKKTDLPTMSVVSVVTGQRLEGCVTISKHASCVYPVNELIWIMLDRSYRLQNWINRIKIVLTFMFRSIIIIIWQALLFFYCTLRLICHKNCFNRYHELSKQCIRKLLFCWNIGNQFRFRDFF